ncbi:MAG: DUF927 domain-containing protein [Xanthomonadales bacterium]|nr:DUF927 domain-containing protein [Xanthomonadales bacterium]
MLTLAERSRIQSPGQPGQPVRPVAMQESTAPTGAMPRGQAGASQHIAHFEVVEGVNGRPSGLYWCDVTIDKDGQESAAPPIWICSPLHVAANTRDGHGSEWGRLLEWKDRDGRQHSWAMPAELLAGTGEELRAALLREGLAITSNQRDRRRLLDYISQAQPGISVRAVRHTGWHGTAFVFPDHTLGDTPDEPIRYQAAYAEGMRLGKAGTLDGWRMRVAMPCVGNSRLVLALSAGFAAPTLGLLDAEGGGFHFRGGSSAGKTTALKAAASIWGPPEFVRTWRATDNALEGVAALHSDLLLCLDEMSELPPKVAGATAYMLANGSGKGRARRDGSARPPARWRVLFCSTGEVGLSDLIAEAGGRARAGQDVRFIDIPADPGLGLGLFERLPEGMTPGAFADSLKDLAAAHHGHAGPAFVSRLVDDFEPVRNALRSARDVIAGRVIPADTVGQVRRVAQRFALVGAAGELATEFGLTGWPEGEAERAATVCFQAWLTARGTSGAAEPTAMLAQVRRFLEAHGDSRFTPWDGDATERPTINRAGFRKTTADGHEYFVLRGAFQNELCSGFDHRAVASVLIKAGALATDGDGGATRTERLPGLGNARCYRILPKIWQPEDA